jgi:hypothetical protein
MVGMLPETNAAAEAEVLLDAWDFKGRPAARSTTGRWGAAAMILGTSVRVLICSRVDPSICNNNGRLVVVGVTTTARGSA